MPVQFTVNGRPASVDAPANTLLVHALREHLHLTGTHVGCDTSQCGACTVLVDGQPVLSCLALAAEMEGRAIETVEGLQQGNALHPLQAAFASAMAGPGGGGGAPPMGCGCGQGEARMAYDYDEGNVFARILRGEIPNQTVAETEHSLAFRDIRPQAPIHVLVIPKGAYVNYDHFGSEASDAEIIDFTRLVADEGPPIDAWSLHLYPLGSPLQAFFTPSWNTVAQAIRQVDRLAPGAPIHVTETGYHTSYNRFHRYFVSEAQQADWLEQTFAMADRYPRVQATIWFNLQDNPQWTGGLYHADMTPKPALPRFTALAADHPLPPDWRP